MRSRTSVVDVLESKVVQRKQTCQVDLSWQNVFLYFNISLSFHQHQRVKRQKRAG